MTRGPVRFRVAAAGAALLAASACGGGGTRPPLEETPETVIGERLFRETRFGRFAALALEARDVNAPLPAGDPALDDLVTVGAPRPGPYAGQSMNCAACHLVDEVADDPAGGARTYGDFARKSPIPAREDGRTTTARNSPPLVGVGEGEPDALFHFDGEFPTLEALVEGTFTGRNFGWLPGERAQAVAHVARVVREDDGSDANAADHGGASYATLFRAPGNLLGRDLLLAPAFRLDVATATDEEVFAAVARIVAQYVRELSFRRRGGTGPHEGSPYDTFLRKNGLPAEPDPLETPLAYGRRLRALVAALPSPRFVDVEDGRLALHAHGFRFGPDALAGLRVFLAEPAASVASPAELAAGGVGNCLACHRPPRFTDGAFHNVGRTERAYDAAHGPGAFAALVVPSLAVRDAAFEAHLPATEAHPDGDGPFLDVEDPLRPGRTDLGLWNVFANPDVPGPQARLRALLIAQLALPPATSDADLLPRTIAWFKTPALRDLGQSPPFFHDGSADDLEACVRHYVGVSDRQRAGAVRNGAPELAGIALREEDVAALVAFLTALDEDYD